MRIAYDAHTMGTSAGWVEIGDGFLVRRYRFYDQNIGLVLGRGEALVIDTRSTHVKGREILDMVLRVASGERTKSEALGLGDNEFVPWQVGAVM